MTAALAGQSYPHLTLTPALSDTQTLMQLVKLQATGTSSATCLTCSSLDSLLDVSLAGALADIAKLKVELVA